MNLHETTGLDAVVHTAPSALDPGTLRAAGGALPEAFLRGVGYSPMEIEALAPLPAASLSCLLVFAAPDREFAERLREDLLAAGLQCRQMLLSIPFGGIRDHRSEAFRLADRVVLVFSRALFDEGKGVWTADPAPRQQRHRAG